MRIAACAMQQQHCIADAAGFVVAFRTERKVVQLELRQRFATSKMEVGKDRRTFGCGPAFVVGRRLAGRQHRCRCWLAESCSAKKKGSCNQESFPNVHSRGSLGNMIRICRSEEHTSEL